MKELEWRSKLRYSGMLNEIDLGQGNRKMRILWVFNFGNLRLNFEMFEIKSFFGVFFVV